MSDITYTEEELERARRIVGAAAGRSAGNWLRNADEKTRREHAARMHEAKRHKKMQEALDRKLQDAIVSTSNE